MSNKFTKISCIVVAMTLILSLSLLIGCKEEAAEEEVVEEVTEEAPAEETTEAQAEQEESWRPEGVEYEWQPVELDRWTITTSYIKDPPYTFALSTGFMGESWMETYVAELTEEVEMYGDDIAEFIHVDAAGDIPTQIANIEDLISIGVDAIIIDPLSPTACVPVVEKAFDAGIVTIVNKNGIDTNKYTAFQNNDEVQFGAQSAQWLVDQLDGKGVVLVLRGVPGYGCDIERYAGAASVFSQYPDIEVFEEYGYWSYDKSKEVSKALIAAHPEFDGIWTMGGQMSNAFVDTLLEADYNPADYPHGSEEQNGYCKKALEYGISTFVSAKPVWQGRLAVRAAMDALRGIPVEHTIMVPSPGYGPEEIEKLTRTDLPDLVWLSTTLSDEKLNELFK